MKKYLRVLLALLAIAAIVLYFFGCPSPTGPADDGSTLSSDATLSALGMVGIDLGPIPLGFVPATTTYNLDVPNSLDQVNVTPVANHSGATIKVNGTSVASGNPITIPFSVGSNVIDVVVTAEDGSTVQSYTVTVNRAASVPTNANLAYLIPSVGTLDPDFDQDILSYDVDVAYSVDEITLTPFVSDQAATVQVDGNDVTHATASDPITLSPGANHIDVVVTAGDGTTTKTYTVTVNRPASNNANLSNLEPSEGSLSPAFSAATTSYTVDVINSVSSIQFRPTAEDPNYDGITVDTAPVASGEWSGAISLDVGDNVVQVEVTAEDGTTTKTYTVTVNRAAPLSSNANLSNLETSEGSLSPAFSAATTSYTVDVINSVSSIQFRPTAEDPNYDGITVDTAPVASGEWSGAISLDVGDNVVQVEVTAEDGTTTKTYTVTVNRAAPLSSNANLSNLETSEGSLSPAFSATTTSYTVDVINSVSSIEFRPTAEDPNYDGITVDTAPVASGEWSGAISLDVGDNVVQTEVTAEDGTTTKTYTVTVNRAAPSPIQFFEMPDSMTANQNLILKREPDNAFPFNHPGITLGSSLPSSTVYHFESSDEDIAIVVPYLAWDLLIALGEGTVTLTVATEDLVHTDTHELTVTTDNIAPKLGGVDSYYVSYGDNKLFFTSVSKICLQFSEFVDPTTAENVDNYAVVIGGAAAVPPSTAVRDSNDNTVVTLTLGTSLSPGTEVTVTVENIEDTVGNVITTESVTETYTAPRAWNNTSKINILQGYVICEAGAVQTTGGLSPQYIKMVAIPNGDDFALGNVVATVSVSSDGSTSEALNAREKPYVFPSGQYDLFIIDLQNSTVSLPHTITVP